MDPQFLAMMAQGQPGTMGSFRSQAKPVGGYGWPSGGYMANPPPVPLGMPPGMGSVIPLAGQSAQDPSSVQRLIDALMGTRGTKY